MISHFYLEGDALKRALVLEGPLYEGKRQVYDFNTKNLTERLIKDYKPSPVDLENDISRSGVILLTRGREEKVYFYGRTKKEIDDKEELTKDKKLELAKDVVNFISDDSLWQHYLFSELHQSGILMIAEAMVKNAAIILNEKPIASFKEQIPGQFTSSHNIKINADGNLELDSKFIFSNRIEGPEDFEKPRYPAFLANAKLIIKLVDNPNAVDDDPLEVKKAISIFPRLDLYVVPGEENFVREACKGFIEQFQFDRVSADFVPKDQHIDFIATVGKNSAEIEENVAIQYIHDQLHKMLFEKELAINEIASIFRPYSEERFHKALNLQDLKGNTLLHEAYYLSDPSIAHHLLLLGAEANIPNNSGKTFEMLWNSFSNVTVRALDPAVRKTRAEIDEFLTRKKLSEEDLSDRDCEIIDPSKGTLEELLQVLPKEKEENLRGSIRSFVGYRKLGREIDTLREYLKTPQEDILNPFFILGNIEVFDIKTNKGKYEIVAIQKQEKLFYQANIKEIVEEEQETVFNRVCEIAVNGAEPGSKYNVRETPQDKQPMILAGLVKALQKRGKMENEIKELIIGAPDGWEPAQTLKSYSEDRPANK